MSRSIADAFMKTRKGKSIVVEAKNAIRPRYRELDHLAYVTYVSSTPPNQNHYHLYKAAKPRIRELAAAGDDKYNEASTALKCAWTDRGHFEKAGKLLVPDQMIRTSLGYRW